jgi:hypothetical protein
LVLIGAHWDRPQRLAALRDASSKELFVFLSMRLDLGQSKGSVMSDEHGIPVHVVEIPDVDAAMFRLRLAGKSTRDIARELRVKEDKVRETVQRMLMPITPQLKLTALQEALERLDLYQASQHQAAVKGDREAIAMCLKIEEQRADLLGTRAPSAVRIDPVQLVEQAQPQPTVSDRIREALDRVAAMKASGTLISGKTAISGDEPVS